MELRVVKNNEVCWERKERIEKERRIEEEIRAKEKGRADGGWEGE